MGLERKPKHNLAGKTFGRWEVLEFSGFEKHGAKWKCKCICSEVAIVDAYSLLSGHSKSCGCLHRQLTADRMRTYACIYPKEYSVYKGMLTRCYNKNSRGYKYYGKRGIAVCGRWLKDFKHFIEDMGERPLNMSIERKNNNKGYSKSNCMWADSATQNQNKCTTKLTKHKAGQIRKRSSAGENACDIAKEFGVHRDTIYDVINGRTWKNVPL